MRIAVEVSQPERPMSRLRAVTTLVILISALCAGGLSLSLSDVREQEAVVNYPQAPWLSAVLLAYCFGILSVPFGITNIHEPVSRILKVWMVFLLISAAIWLIPMLLAPRFGWTFGGCTNFSLFVTLTPTFWKPLRLVYRNLRIPRPDSGP